MKSFHAAGTIDSGGFQLRYIIEGEGSPILVIGSALYDERIFFRGPVRAQSFLSAKTTEDTEQACSWLPLLVRPTFLIDHCSLIIHHSSACQPIQDVVGVFFPG